MDVTQTPRVQNILRFLAASAQPVLRSAVEEAIGESRVTTVRELGQLVKSGYVVASGESRATVYAITEAGRGLATWDVEQYLAEEPDKRHARYTHIEPSLFAAIRGSLDGGSSVLTDAAALAVKKRHRSQDDTTNRKELERFVIELSWKSSKIEGNTYTLLDTERLIVDAAEAPGHSHDEATMILNHKRAFDYIWQHRDSFHQLTRTAVDEVHRLLVAELGVPVGLRTSPVGITGTAYVPPASRDEISSYLGDIISVVNSLDRAEEKALACLMLLPYLQPFADGNKRTSRLIANAVLLAGGLPPLSYRSVDEQAYKGALILFYEQGTVANFRDLFVEQLKDSALDYFFHLDSAEAV